MSVSKVRLSILSAAIGLVAIALLWSSCDDNQPLRPPRVILISMDTVRADHVSGYGSATTTPVLASIAAEGVRFQNFYSASSYTIPSTMSILTGLDPQEHGMAAKATRLSPDVPLLAELMTDAGYRTQAFHEGGYVAGRFGFERGFAEYKEVPRIAAVDESLPEVTGWMRDNADEPYFLFIQTYAAHFPYGGMDRYRKDHPERGLPDAGELDRLRTELTDAKSKGLTEEERQRYALYNHFAEQHSDRVGGYRSLLSDFPDTKHFELDVEQMKSSYDERIRLIDSALGSLRATLVELGQWEDTLFVVVSDHGEAFFEHGLEQHDYVPFNECFKVPAVISYPRVLRERSGHVIEGLAWHLDLVPTILALTGQDARPNLRGRDLSSVLLGLDEIEADRAIYPAVLKVAFRAQADSLRRLVIQGDDKWVEGHELFGDAEGLLFDLGDDPGEHTNLRENNPDRFDELAGMATRYEGQLVKYLPVHQDTSEVIDPNSDVAPPKLTPAEEDALYGLGYGLGFEDEDNEAEQKPKKD